jgi:chemotaxis protein methyltransferase CheR
LILDQRMQPLQDDTFRKITDLMHAIVGLSFSDAKKALVSARLAPRVQRLEVSGFDEYFELISGFHGVDELQVAVDLLTTNETYFFREPRHFELLEQELLRQRPAALSVWSAAASTGDEAYSVAMLLSDMQRQGRLGSQWSILGTDISDRVLHTATAGVYAQERLRQVSPERLHRYCLRGEGESEGLIKMTPALMANVRFGQLNLCQPIEQIGPFDVIFLRNVLIYFDLKTRRAVVDRVLSKLRVGGLFFIGTAEGRAQCDTPLQPLAPGAFRKLAI